MREEKIVTAKAMGSTHTAASAIRQSYTKSDIPMIAVDIKEPASAGT